VIRHRHLETDEWTLDAIDSVIDRGELEDWRELFRAARGDRALVEKIVHVTEAHDMGGASLLARELALQLGDASARP
jgi:hypothetical protein